MVWSSHMIKHAYLCASYLERCLIWKEFTKMWINVVTTSFNLSKCLDSVIRKQPWGVQRKISFQGKCVIPWSMSMPRSMHIRRQKIEMEVLKWSLKWLRNLGMWWFLYLKPLSYCDTSVLVSIRLNTMLTNCVNVAFAVAWFTELLLQRDPTKASSIPTKRFWSFDEALMRLIEWSPNALLRSK